MQQINLMLTERYYLLPVRKRKGVNVIKITEQGTVHLQGTPETLISDVIMIAVTAQYRLKQENPLYLAVLNK